MYKQLGLVTRLHVVDQTLHADLQFEDEGYAAKLRGKVWAVGMFNLTKEWKLQAVCLQWQPGKCMYGPLDSFSGVPLESVCTDKGLETTLSQLNGIVDQYNLSRPHPITIVLDYPVPSDFK